MRTGHYISPHLHRYNERIRIDGQPIAPEGFAAAMTEVRAAIEPCAPQFPDRALLAFDALTAAAFVAFREAPSMCRSSRSGSAGCWIRRTSFRRQAVMHNRGQVLRPVRTGQQSSAIDRSRNQNPTSCVMTPISLEHTAILGDTVAGDRAPEGGDHQRRVHGGGSAAAGVGDRCVRGGCGRSRRDADRSGEGVPGAADIGEQRRAGVPAEDGAREVRRLKLPLAGRHQLENAVTAVVACEERGEGGRHQTLSAAARCARGWRRWCGRGGWRC